MELVEKDGEKKYRYKQISAQRLRENPSAPFESSAAIAIEWNAIANGAAAKLGEQVAGQGKEETRRKTGNKGVTSSNWMKCRIAVARRSKTYRLPTDRDRVYLGGGKAKWVVQKIVLYFGAYLLMVQHVREREKICEKPEIREKGW